MKALSALAGRYSRVLLYGTWFWALSGLLANRRYEDFLRPEFGLLPAVGLLAVLAFGFIELGRTGKNPRTDLGGALRWAVLIAPLLYLPLTRGVALDGAAFDKRWTGLNGFDRTPSAPLIEWASQAVSSGVPSVTLADLCRNAELYNGRRIAVDGMIKHVPEIAAEFGPNTCLLYRFVISCCVADAVPAAILLVGKLPSNNPDDTWIKAEGVFKLENRDGRDVILLDLEHITHVSRPRNPYLY